MEVNDLPSCRCTLVYKPGTHLSGGWAGPRASLDEFRKEKTSSDGVQKSGPFNLQPSRYTGAK
jgi:hypothetical protein